MYTYHIPHKNIEGETPMQTSEVPEARTQLDGFHDFVQDIIQKWKVPGVAIAIVKDNEVIFSEGIGLRNVKQELAMTPQTLMPIASCTKAFTTAAMALLVDAGKLDWDTPVRHYLPTFKLYDAVATERLTPRDLVTHRSGLPRHDLMWYNNDCTRQELFDRLQYLEPSKDIRTTWQYQNLMYMTAGYLVGEVVGQSWEEFVQQQLFDRLNMKSSNFSAIASQQMPDFALSYSKKKDATQRIPFYEDKWAVAPAGAIVSNVAEMSHWISLHLNKGKYGATRLVSEGQIDELHAPQMVMPTVFKFAESPLSSYALGWVVSPYRGHMRLAHGGNIDGFSSLVTLLTEEKIGIIVLTNLTSNAVPDIVTMNAIDRLLGMEEVTWNDRLTTFYKEVEAAAEKGKEKMASDRVPDTHPSHALTDYVGEYEHPGYGIITVDLENEMLQSTLHAMKFPLEHYHYDIFEANVERFEIIVKLSFATNVKGDIESLSVPLEPEVPDIVFKRVPRKEMLEKSFLEQFTGEYEVMGITIVVAFKNEHTLSVTVPQQPIYELEAYKGTSFRFKGLTGYSIEFKRNADGTVTEAEFEQPFGVVTAKKKIAS
jgi:CubicO group peptidase (beta-lactamase class C family)